MSQNPKTISKKKSNLKKLPQLQLLQMEQLNTIADGLRQLTVQHVILILQLYTGEPKNKGFRRSPLIL